MSAESEELQARIEELKNENKMTEDALTKASMTHSLQVSNLNTEITLLTSQYEKERASKEKVDAEVCIIRNPLFLSPSFLATHTCILQKVDAEVYINGSSSPLFLLPPHTFYRKFIMRFISLVAPSSFLPPHTYIL